MDSKLQTIREEFEESAMVKQRMARTLAPDIARAAEMMVRSLSSGGKILLLGNGGSAADAQHIAAELVGRFHAERRPLPAIALTTDTSILTSLANDYGAETMFSRQVEALANANDVVIAISTSGQSANVLEAVRAAKAKGARTIGLSGYGGGELKSMVDLSIVVPSDSIPRIQEAHITVGHILCRLVEEEIMRGVNE